MSFGKGLRNILHNDLVIGWQNGLYVSKIRWLIPLWCFLGEHYELCRCIMPHLTRVWLKFFWIWIRTHRNFRSLFICQERLMCRRITFSSRFMSCTEWRGHYLRFFSHEKKIKEKKVGFAVQSFDPLWHNSWGLTTMEKTGFENNVGKRRICWFTSIFSFSHNIVLNISNTNPVIWVGLLCLKTLWISTGGELCYGKA